MLQLLRGALAQRMRLVRTASAVALAVSLVSGTFVLTDTINSAYQDAANSSDGFDVVVRATSQFSAQGNSLPEREVLPESLLAVVEGGPRRRRPVGVGLGLRRAGRRQGPVARRPGRARPSAPRGPPTGASPPGGPRPAPARSSSTRPSPARTASQLGDRIKVLFQGLVEEFKIAGLRKLEGLLSTTQATFDLQTAQRVFGQEGSLDAIPVKADPGVSPDALRARIGAILPERYEVVTYDQAAKEAAESWTKALGFLTTALMLFAAVALLVGAFIIFNTFSILVAQRTRELGLLRALGASRSHLIASVLAEAVVVGLVASVAGIVLGVLAARGLLAVMAATGFDLPPASVVFRPRTAPRLPDDGGGRHRRRRRRAGPAGDEGLPALRRQRPVGRQRRRHPPPGRVGDGGRRRRHGLALPRPLRAARQPADRHRPRRRRLPAGPVDADPAGGGAGVPGPRGPAGPPVRPARPARPGERHAQPPPHRRHRRRPDDRDHPGRRGVDPRRLHEGVRHGGGERDPAGRLRGGRQGLERRRVRHLHACRRRPAAQDQGSRHGVGVPHRPVGPERRHQDPHRRRPQDRHRDARPRPVHVGGRRAASTTRACSSGPASPSARGGRSATRCP